MVVCRFKLISCIYILGIGVAGLGVISAFEANPWEKSVYRAHPEGISEIVSQKVGALEGVGTPSTMAVEGNDLFVVDENLVIRVYSIDPFAQKFTIGRKGEGPAEFRYSPHLWVYADVFVASDFLKALWFTRSGEFIKAVKYSDFPDFDTGQEMQLFPVGDCFIRNIVDHKGRKRTVILLDSKLQPLKTLYEGLFDWNQVGGPGGFNLLTHRIEVAAGDSTIFVSDTEKGFFIRVFDFDGNEVGTISLNGIEEPIPASEADREKLLEEVRLTRQEAVYRFAKANARMPEAFPRIHQIRHSGGRLYVTTHREKKGLHEMLVLDRRGNILDRLFLPLESFHHFRGPFRSDFFTVSGGTLYELVKNADTQSWELLRTDLSEKVS
jgi:hypothetical protein